MSADVVTQDGNGHGNVDYTKTANAAEVDKFLSDLLSAHQEATGKYVYLLTLFRSDNLFLNASTSVLQPRDIRDIYEDYKIMQIYEFMATPRDEFSMQDMLNMKRRAIIMKLRLYSSLNGTGLTVSITEKKEFTQRSIQQPAKRSVMSLLAK